MDRDDRDVRILERLLEALAREVLDAPPEALIEVLRGIGRGEASVRQEVGSVLARAIATAEDGQEEAPPSGRSGLEGSSPLH